MTRSKMFFSVYELKNILKIQERKNTLKITTDSHSQNVYKQHNSQNLFLNRKEAKQYQMLLGKENQLFHEISCILAIHQSGIHSLSNGQKVNATRFHLLGGGVEIPGAIKAKISSKSELKSYYYEAPQGKYIKSYKIEYKGKQEDINRIESSLYSFGCNSKTSEEESNDWSKNAEFGIKEGFTKLDATAHGAFKSTIDKLHKRASSNQMVVLDLRSKGAGFFETQGAVEVIVDIEIDDTPEERNILAKEVITKISESISQEGSIEALVGNQAALREIVDKITKLEAIIHKCTAKKDIKAEANVPPVETPEQMKRRVDVNHLTAQIDKIDKEIAELKKEKEKFFEDWRQSKKDKEDEDIVKEIKAKYDKAKEDVLTKETRKKEFQEQIDDIFKKRGKEPEKK